jgi:glycerate 2-kinase
MERSKITQSMRSDALEIFQAGLRAANPVDAVERNFQKKNETLVVKNRTYSLDSFSNIYVIGAGKASAAMAHAVEKVLKDRITAGWINVKYGYSRPLDRITVHEAGHPVPDKSGLEGSLRISARLKTTRENDLVIVLLSGGGSALLPCPADGLSLEDKQQTTQILLETGADINEINSIRKHLSCIKGGHLAQQAFPATVVTLILSDVIRDRLSTIASGPTAPDESTFLDCRRIVSKYGIENRIPLPVLKFLESGLKGEKEETLKAEDPVFKHVHNVIVGNNFLAVEAARTKAEDLGYNSLILSSGIEGETREIAKMHASIAEEIIRTGNPTRRPACLVSGGETTVKVIGNGLGGRNQEFVLASAIALSGLEDVVVLSCGTDGTDGPTDAAGAIADGQTEIRAQDRGMNARDYLSNNDSYHFFHALDDLILTGPTLTNVMDIRILLVK